jgi:hypothetical protein
MHAIAIDNLAAFGVEEMDIETADQVEGGFPWVGLAVGLLVGVIREIINDPGAAGAAFMEGFNATSG